MADDYEVAYARQLSLSEPREAPLFYPSRDVDVHLQSPTILTAEPGIPDEANSVSDWNEVVRAGVSLLKRPWTTVVHKDAAYRAPPPVLQDADLDPLEFEVDPGFPEDLQKLPKLSKTRGLQRPCEPRAELAAYEAELASTRRPLFDLYPMMQEELARLDDRERQEPKALAGHEGSMRLRVVLRELHFSLGSDEPYFVSAALYDTSSQEKLTEDVYFQNNDLARVGREPGAPETMCRGAVFECAQGRPSIVLLLRVSKVLRGDTAEATLEPYMRHDSLSRKAMERHMSDIHKSLRRMHSLLQPLCYAAVELFTPQGTLQGDLHEPVDMYASPKASFGADYVTEKLIPFLLERKARSLPGVMALEISALDKPIPGVLNPSLVPLLPTGGEFLLREAQSFARSSTHLKPEYEYVNNLYVTLHSLNLSKLGGKARNLLVEVRLKRDDEDPLAQGLPLVYGRLLEGKFLSSGTSHVFYHNKKPQFIDEIKLRLPANLSPAYHLVFIFSHVTCKPNKSPQATAPANSIATPVAFAFLPLTEGKEGAGIVPERIFELPVSSSFPAHYLSCKADEEDDGLKWIDKRPSFSVSLKLVSSVMCQEATLNRFLSAGHSGAEGAMDPLSDVPETTLIRNLPRVLDTLFYVVATRTASAAAGAVRHMLAVLQRVSAATRDSRARHPFFDSYVAYVLHVPKGPAMPLLNLVGGLSILMEDESRVDHVARFAWFFFDAIIKWIVLISDERQLLDDATRPRRVATGVITMLNKLLQAFLERLRALSLEQIGLAKELNRSVSFFLHDLLSVLDRGVTLSLIEVYVENLHAPGLRSSSLLAGFKFESLAIICNHEHFVSFNMPSLGFDVPNVSSLVGVWSKRHPLVGILLRAIFKHQTDEDKDVRLTALVTLRNLLLKHERDGRLEGLRERVYSMYFPYCLLFVQHREEFWASYSLEERRVAILCFVFILRRSQRSLLSLWWRGESVRLRTRLFHTLCRALLTFEYKGRAHIATVSQEYTATKMTRVKKLSSYNSVSARVRVRRSSVAFDKRPSLGGSARLPFSASTTSSASPELGGALAASGASAPKLRSFARARTMASRSATTEEGVGATKAAPATDPAVFLKEAALSAEVLYTVCDVVASYVHEFASELQLADDVMFSRVIDTLVHLLHVNHCAATFERVASLVRLVVTMFPDALFVHQTPYAGQLCFQLMVLFSSRCGRTRLGSASLFYVMLRQNWMARGNLTRMKLAATVAVNRTSDPSLKVALVDEHFRMSLKVVNKCASSGDPKSKLPEAFQEDLRDLNLKLKSVLLKMSKIRTYSYDPEYLADLYTDICDEYRSSPDLRAAWLATLAAFHEAQGNSDEAAQCKIHLAGLVCSYLALLKPQHAVPIDELAFEAAAPNIRGEFRIPPDLAKDEGICQSEVFTRDGLFRELEGSVGLLKRGGLFESCIAVERLMAAIHQRNRNWHQLAINFSDLSDMCQRITEEEVESSRLFSLYYRVAFHGSGDPEFRALVGKKFIYKERPEVVISDITSRIKAQYEGAFGADRVHVLPNKEVDASTLEEGHLYFQIVAVKPHLSKKDLATRHSEYERQTNLQRFISETPFSKSGKNRGDWEDQCKRKEILSVPMPFPCLRKRQQVTHIDEKLLGPCANALEVISSRVEALKKENEAANPSTKTVQNVLQGSVMLQVNPGPMKIAEVFLSKENAALYDKKDIRRLQKMLSLFVGEARKLLLLNNSLIGAEQLEYQELLTSGFNDMREKLEPYLGKEDKSLPV